MPKVKPRKQYVPQIWEIKKIGPIINAQRVRRSLQYKRAPSQ